MGRLVHDGWQLPNEVVVSLLLRVRVFNNCVATSSVNVTDVFVSSVVDNVSSVFAIVSLSTLPIMRHNQTHESHTHERGVHICSGSSVYRYYQEWFVVNLYERWFDLQSLLVDYHLVMVNRSICH